MLLETDASEALLVEGRRHLFAFRMKAAEAAFRTLLQRSDGEPAAYYQLATVALFKGLVTDDPAHFKMFMARSDTLDALLDERPVSNWHRQMKASTNLQRALAAGKLERYIRAAMAARSAYNGFEALVGDAPDFAEAYMGMGLLHLTVASLPAGYRRLLSVLGFGGTAEEGINELKHAATHSRFNQELAHMSIALADIILRDRVPEGTDRLAQLYERDSKSLLFTHLYGFALYTDRRPQRAETVLRPAVEKQASPSYFYIDYLDYYLAEAHFVQNEFAEAEAAYRRYLRRHDGPALRAMGYYRLGLALEMQGRRDEATNVYRKVDPSRDFDNDLVAKRRAQVQLEQPMTSIEEQLIRGENAFHSRQHDAAERMLRDVFQSQRATPVNKARAAFYIGRIHHVQGQYAQAHPAYHYAIQHPGNPQAEWGPWAQLYMADMYAERGKTQEAVQAYQAALDWETPFDYYQALEQRARIALEQIQDT
jgi:tetratricopeptide (TPR) repeat protein